MAPFLGRQCWSQTALLYKIIQSLWNYVAGRYGRRERSGDNNQTAKTAHISCLTSKYPPAEPGALEREPLKAAVGEASAHVSIFCSNSRSTGYWYCSSNIIFLRPFGSRLHLAFALASCVPYASPSPIMKFFFVCLVAHGWDLHRWATPVNVKLLLPPRQSRGNSHFGLEGLYSCTSELQVVIRWQIGCQPQARFCL